MFLQELKQPTERQRKHFMEIETADAELSKASQAYREAQETSRMNHLIASQILPDKYRKIYRLRKCVCKTFEEVGKEFGVTRERIRQIEAKCQEAMKQKYAE